MTSPGAPTGRMSALTQGAGRLGGTGDLGMEEAGWLASPGPSFKKSNNVRL